MRICHVSPHLPPDQAANALLPAHLGRSAHEAGHAVTFVTQASGPRRDGASGQLRDALPGPVRETRRRSTSGIERLLRIDGVRRAQSIANALTQVAGDADLLHLHSNGLIIEVASAWARRRGKPTVLTLYGTEIWHYRQRWPVDPFTRAYRGADAVTFYSQKLLERARELGLDRPQLSVVYPPVSAAFGGADDETRNRWRRELGIAEPRVVLNVKRLHPLAGQRHLIDAFADIARNDADVRLIICGSGELRAELEARAAGAGVLNRVTFTGLVANEVVARYAAVADVFVLPSELEALPTVAVEALAAGTPVVSTDHPGGVELHALFGDDVQVVPRGDVAGLTRLLRSALSVPRRTRPATEALVRSHFSPQAVSNQYLDLYERVLGRLRTR